MKLRASNFWALIFKTIRNGMIMVLPVTFIGSFAVLVVNFPIPAFQNFISTFAGGAIQSLLFLIQLSTLGLLPVYMTISINLSYTNATQEAPKFLSKLTMGRCQGGFCSPRVTEIISRERGIPMTSVTKNGGCSYILNSKTR